MGKFDDILKKSLDGLNDKYEQAKEDLESMVASLRDAIATAAEPATCKLELTEISSSAEESVFRISATRPFRRESITIGHYRITLGGYPIDYGNVDDADDFIEEGTIQNSDELEEHFAQMLGNKSSPLVLFIAFLRRMST